MKKTITTLILFASITAFAQQEKLTPAFYFLDKPINQESIFVDKINQLESGYAIRSTDTLKRMELKLRHAYYNTDGDSMIIYNTAILTGADADLKIKGEYTIINHRVYGQFLTMLDLWNKMFGKSDTAEKIKSKTIWSGPIEFADSRYWYIFQPVSSGYWELILKVNR
jgi:hypothetical protein